MGRPSATTRSSAASDFVGVLDAGSGNHRERKLALALARGSLVLGVFMRILTIDVGGTKAKLLMSGEHEPRRVASGPAFTPQSLVETVANVAADWDFEAISIGLPAVIGRHGVADEPGNLGAGWAGFDFAAAFGKPTKVMNDAAMQALGSYDGGRMLFLGLGTGVGSTFIAANVITPLELGNLPYRSRSLTEWLSRRALAELGKRRWRQEAVRVAGMLHRAFAADYVVIGGGNAKLLRKLEPGTLPPGIRIGHNRNAFRGGFRLWGLDVAPTQHHGHNGSAGVVSTRMRDEWRLV